MPLVVETIAAIALAVLPEAAAASITAFTATTVVGTITVGSLLSSVSAIAIGLGISYLAMPNMTSKPAANSQAGQTTINESTAPRQRVYGRAMVGGGRMLWANLSKVSIPTVLGKTIDMPAVYVDAFGGGFAGRVSVIAHCQGPIDAIEQYWFADEVVTVPSEAVFDLITINTPMKGNCKVMTMRGRGSQETMPALKQIFPSFWGDNDRARGICYTAAFYNSVSLNDFQTIYKSGEPPFRVVMRGALVWDPRDVTQTAIDNWDEPTTWKWSNNPALCILDFLRHPDGRNKPLSKIDVQSFVDFANLCDELVSLKHGGTEKRYRIGGTYSLADEAAAIQRRLLATCDGELYRTPAGLIGIRGGKWTAPTLTFTGEAVIEYTLSQGIGKLSAFNRTTTTYTSPDHDYQQVEAAPWVDPISEAIVGSLPTSLELDMVQSHSQARRLSKINAAKSNPNWRGSITLDISGLNAITERVIRVVLPDDDLGIDETFLVQKYTISPDFTRVSLDVSSIDASAYSWDAITEEGDAPELMPTVETSAAVPVPAGLSLSIATGSYGSVNANSILISVTPPSDTSLRLLVRWAPTGSGNWDQYTTATGTFTFDTGVLAAGTYDVQARFVATSAVQGDWTSVSTITVPTTATAPGSPINLSATNSSGTVALSAISPNSSNVNSVVFWRSSGTSFAGATRIATVYCGPNQTVSSSNAPGTGTWRYWATAENSVQQSSAATGPATVTV